MGRRGPAAPRSARRWEVRLQGEAQAQLCEAQQHRGQDTAQHPAQQDCGATHIPLLTHCWWPCVGVAVEAKDRLLGGRVADTRAGE